MEKRIRIAKDFFSRAVRMWQDGIMSNNAEWQREEQRDACIMFVAMFLPVADAFVAGKMPENCLEAYVRLETAFRRYFGVWSVCEDFLKHQENPHGHWFLLESPRDRPVRSIAQLRDEHIAIMGKLLREEELTDQEQKKLSLFFSDVQRDIREKY